MKATTIAPSNIAFIKFFGKINEALRLPANNSISMCLSGALTTTTVEFSPLYKKDSIEILRDNFNEEEKRRIVEHLERIRKLAQITTFAKVVTKNSFPKSSGIASSASGFAALTLSAVKACRLNIPEKELTILTRLASGSSCRSIPDGFVEWKKSKTSENSYAYSLYSPTYWNICDVLVILEDKPKKVTTTDAHKLALTSPFYKERIMGMEEKIERLKQALKKKDFLSFGEIIETEALNMHAVMMTTNPPLFYWSEKTVKLILAIWEWRKKGLSVYFTIDAGPNVHLVCEEKNKKEVVSYLQSLNMGKIIVNKPSIGARLTNKHLF